MQELVFESNSFVGFVKQECAGSDPSVNHLIVVDSTTGRPQHSCDYEQGGTCTGSNSDLDDDILTGIGPGSPILYVLYSTEAGPSSSCLKADKHRAIFDAAIRCLRSNDPAAAHGGQHAGTQPLVEVVVSMVANRPEIVFGGTAGYTGWKTGGSPEVVDGPGGGRWIQFSEGQSLQLGAGVQVSGSYTVDCRVHITSEARDVMAGGVLLLSSEDGNTLSIDSEIESGLLAATEGEWHQLTIQTSTIPPDSVQLNRNGEPCSARTCQELGWDNFDGERNRAMVCGESDAGFDCTESVALAEARQVCQNSGARLCTATELRQVLAGPDACQYSGDGECDEPQYCPAGTDTTDCSGGAGPSAPTGCGSEGANIWSSSSSLGGLICSGDEMLVLSGRSGAPSCSATASVRCCADVVCGSCPDGEHPHNTARGTAATS